MMEPIRVKTQINSTIEKTWECWTNPEHITGWNFAADEWLCPSAVNSLTPGGQFSWRMEARDGSMGFDYSGKYETVEQYKVIKKLLDDGRKVEISFDEKDGFIEVVETFDPESENPVEMQKSGWQAILDNFKKYVESK